MSVGLLFDSPYQNPENYAWPAPTVLSNLLQKIEAEADWFYEARITQIQKLDKGFSGNLQICKSQ